MSSRTVLAGALAIGLSGALIIAMVAGGIGSKRASGPRLADFHPASMNVADGTGIRPVSDPEAFERTIPFRILLPAYLPAGMKLEHIQYDQRASFLLMTFLGQGAPGGMYLEEHGGKVELGRPASTVKLAKGEALRITDQGPGEKLAWTICGRTVAVKATLPIAELVRIADSIRSECK